MAKRAGFKPTSFKGQGTQYSEIEFTGYAGLNNKYSNVEIEDNEASDLLNVEFDARGAIVKRKGYSLVKNFSTLQINSIIPFYKSTGSAAMVVSYDNSLAQYDPISQTLTSITTTLNEVGGRFSGAIDTPHDKLYMVNGNSTDGLMCWDGTTFTTKISGAPNGKYLVYYKNHLYMAGDPSAPYRLYMSDQGDPTSWPALNYIDFTEGGPITGMAQLGDAIVVFKERRAFVLKGSDPSNYAVVDTFAGNHGCISHWSIVQIPNGLLFLSRDGVYLFDGKKFELISDKIQGSVDQWNQQQLTNAVAFEYDHKYWLSVPEGLGQSTNNYTYAFSYLYGWWTKHNIPMQSCAAFTDTHGKQAPYFGDTAGNVFEADNTDSDNGNSIDAYLVTKNYNLGTSAHYKAFKGILMAAQAQAGNYSLAMSFILDFGVNSKTIQMPLSYPNASVWGTAVWGVDKWGGSGEIVHTSTNMPGQAIYLQFRVEGSGKDAPFTFLGWVLRYKVKRRLA